MKLLLILLVFVSFSSFAGNKMNTMAERLHSLRAEVEDLNLKLDSKKKQYQSELQSLSLQKGDLSAEYNREKIQAEQISVQVKKLKDRVSGTSGEDQAVKVEVDKVLSLLTNYVDGTLPYKKNERLADLKKINELLNNKLLTPQKAMVRLWSFVEDELRLTKDSTLSRQNIILKGQSKLAKVVKIGMINMYFATQDNQVGQVIKNEQGNWSYVISNDKNQIELIKKIMASFKKKIRKGYFNIPNMADL